MNSTSPDLSRIVVDVPHWSASVAVIDNDLRPVTDIGKVAPVDDDPFRGRIEIAVPPGLYEVRVSLNGHVAAQWVVAPEDGVATLERGSWTGLTLDTAMPLPAAAPGPETNDRLSHAAALASTRAPRQNSDTRLLLFATAAAVPDGEIARDFDLDVALLDAQGEIVVTLADPEAGLRVVPRRMWRCAFDLHPGYYVLRAPLPRVEDTSRCRYQPLYLCAGLETHVFLRCDGPPDFATLSLHMAPLGAGFQPGGDEALAADAVLAALAGGDAERVMFGSERMEQLLAGEYHNPWLSILAAHALLQRGTDGHVAELLDDIYRHLENGPLTDHPDARALLLGTPGEHLPIDVPPTLRAGLRRIREAACARAGIIAPDSPLAGIGEALIADSAWTTWIDPVPPGQAISAADEDGTGVVMPAAIPAFVEAFPASAPVWPMDEWVEKPADQAVAEGATLAVHAAIIAAANEALADVCNDRTGTLQVELGEEDGILLAMTPEEVSRSTGVALDTVVRDFATLKRSQPGEALAGESENALRRPLGVLVAAIQAKHAGTIVTQAADDTPPPSAVTPIETMVKRLASESARLVAAADDAAADAAILRSLATDLDDLRARLLKQAHLVIVADETGRLRYCNRLLRDRLTERAGGSRAVIARMTGVFARMDDERMVVDAAELSPNSPEGQAGVDVEIRRRRLTAADGETLIGLVYMIRTLSARELEPEEMRTADELLQKVTLYAAMVEFGEGTRRSEKLTLLAQVVDDLRRLLPV